MALGKNVKALRDARGWKLRDLSKRSGVPVGTIGALEVRDSVRSEYAAQLAKAFEIPLEELLAADQSGVIAQDYKQNNALAQSDQDPKAINSISNISAARAYSGEVPVINWVQAGAWQEVAEAVEPERYLPIFRGHSSNSYALRVRGDSMTAAHGKSYPDGCYIIVDPAKVAPTNGDRVVARLKGVAEATFKVFKNEDGRQWLAPLNTMHQPIYDGFTVIGTVIGKWEDE